MVHFTKLKLAGFKSFVESTELLIEPGMTGVVGPNGCGKSNLVEGLKWVMGETSAKQMRGGEMDDVIFGGSADRPARNIAEVTVSVDNSTRKAPPMFNDQDELAVTRRITRSSGSNYKVNGKDVRARDVQLLFADMATGARSTAIVSQGRIGTLINAKPVQRRSLLEEAAGISGLYTRRHEAELRLRGAEGNLERLEDVLGALDTQMQGLTRQAKQAARYRDLSERIRRTEAIVLHLKWVEAITLQEVARQRLKDAEAKVNDLTGAAASGSKVQAEAAVILPPLRQAEAEAGARLHRLVLEREKLDDEEKRISALTRDTQQRAEQIAMDMDREKERTTDATQAIKTLEEERASLEADREGEEEAGEAAKVLLHKVNEEVNAIEADLTRLTEEMAATEARRAAAARRVEETDARKRRLERRTEEIQEQRRKALEDAVGKEQLDAAEQALTQATQQSETARTAAEVNERSRIETRAALEAAQDAYREKQVGHARLTAEAEALEDLLAQDMDGDWTPVIDDLTVEPGFETALATALGDDLSAATDPNAARHWAALLPLDHPSALPDGVRALSEVVKAPAVLSRRLSQIGIVEDVGAGDHLRTALQPGQRLVTTDGAFWRWDGLTATEGSPDAAAARLKQRNRLTELAAQIADSEAYLARAAHGVEQARTAADASANAEQQAREDSRQADRALAQARESQLRWEQKFASAETRIGTLDETLAGVEAELKETEAHHRDAVAAQNDVGDLPENQEKSSQLRSELAEKRTLLVEARSAYDRLAREADQRRTRLDAIDRDTLSWRDRATAGAKHLEDLDIRKETAADELKQLQGRPAEIDAARKALLSTTAEAETARREAADKLAAAELKLTDADRTLKEAEHTLGIAREERVRCEGVVEQGKQTCHVIATRIHEQLDCTPEKVLEEARLDENETLPPLDQAERTLDRATREREAMGPVNLRAEQEASELEEQIGGLNTEREDLIAAIARLRQAIAELNKEGRERLLASFEDVDRHFRSLFVRLFGGGRAHLTLTESDDPLEAGLEIMASPPGKRLQILSLLSGGEQAMTALALLFAVFLTNPAPICILDEVDAPLDDANVDRFCKMLDEIAHSSATRFLCVTHHRMTMARMDRLFGVTMAERGVSQLVSVDLQRAAELAETP